MHEMRVFENLTWVRGPCPGYAVPPPAPRLSGVYAYAETLCIHGLPSVVRWIYVGQARLLATRLVQHHRGMSGNPNLEHWLKQVKLGRELWYAHAPMADLDQLERDLIVGLQPQLNRLRYRSHAHRNGDTT